MIHVMPMNDDREHEETATCWCKPIVEDRDRKTGRMYATPIVIHSAMDGRELIEQAIAANKIMDSMQQGEANE